MDRLSIPEYGLLMKAVELKEIDKAFYIHLQAFKNLQVQATKPGKKGRPVYSRFEKFFNYDRLIQNVLGIKKKEDSKISRLKDYISKKEGERSG